MSVSAEMYIVISLMFAVFAAVAAIGTSLVLGVGFERLRAGFEVVKKQTGFFADAIHQLDERTRELDEKAAAEEAIEYRSLYHARSTPRCVQHTYTRTDIPTPTHPHPHTHTSTSGSVFILERVSA